MNPSAAEDLEVQFGLQVSRFVCRLLGRRELTE